MKYICKNEGENEKQVTQTSHRSNKLRTSRHGYKYAKYKNCPGMMMLILIKQYLSNI